MDINDHGGYYHQGSSYGIDKRMAVIEAFLDRQKADVDMDEEMEQDGRSFGALHIREVAADCRVGVRFAYNVVQEYLALGYVREPSESQDDLREIRQQYTKLGPEESLVLLALRCENDQQLLTDYQRGLQLATGTVVCATTIDNFFKKRFEHKGSLRKSSMVPLDKWKPSNIQAYHEFMRTIASLPRHDKFHFIDEKHIVNKDCYNNRVRADPITGAVRCILVSGNFRRAYNMIAIIRCNQVGPPMHYSIGEENGTAANFTAYIEYLLEIGWFQPYDVLILDNAAIHSGAEAAIVADLLWEVRRVVVVPLPTRAPELNPIELVFHILARRLRQNRYFSNGIVNAATISVPNQVQEIVSTITAKTVIDCAIHCGY